MPHPMRAFITRGRTGPSLGAERGCTRLVAFTMAWFVATPAFAQTLAPEDALALALEANPALRAAVFESVAAREGARSARDARAPVLTASVDGGYTETLTGTADGAVRNVYEEIGAGLGLLWTSDVGTVVDVSIETGPQWRRVNRDPSTTQLFTVGPNFVGAAVMEMRQPLMRGAGRDAVLANERAAAATSEQSLRQTEATASQLIQDVLTAYWQLWYTERALAVETEAVALAARQLADAEQRVGLGTLPRSEALRFASELASLRTTRRSAEVNVRAAAIELGRILGGTLSTHVRVRDREPEVPTLPTLDALEARATAASPDILALAAEVEAARQRAVAARDAARARLDLVARAGMNALWAQGDRFEGAALPDGRPAFVGTGALELELPLGSNSLRAERDQALAELASAEARLLAKRQEIDASVRSGWEELVAAAEIIPLATESARAARALADAERQRLELGTSTISDLLEAQQEERVAELRRLRTLVDAQASLFTLAHVTGTLLDRFAITVDDRGVSAGSLAPTEAP